MEIYLDDQPLTPTDSASTLGEVIDEARASMTGPDRVIVGIRCDGVDIANGDLAAKLTEPASKYSRVDLDSGRAEQLVIDALHQAFEVLDDSDVQRAQVVEWLAQGETAKAKLTLVECFGHWSQVHQAIVQSIAFLKLDEAALIVDGQPLVIAVGEICEKLRQVKEVLEVGDDVLLNDLLEYEFDGAVGKWRAVMVEILGRAQSAIGD